jgi:hypothetical protein
MVGTKHKRRLVGGVLTVGALIAFGGGSAFAATTVTSDTVKYSAVANPGPVAGTYTVQSTSCGVKSDLEAAVPCQLSGQLKVSATGTLTLTSTVTSQDGQTTSTATGKRSSTGSFKLSGKGKEADNPDRPGTPPPPPYPCTVKGLGKLTPNSSGGFNITGSLTVSELSTQP